MAIWCFIRGDIYFQGVVIKTVYLNRDTFEPDLVITEQAERIKARKGGRIINADYPKADGGQ